MFKDEYRNYSIPCLRKGRHAAARNKRENGEGEAGTGRPLRGEALKGMTKGGTQRLVKKDEKEGKQRYIGIISFKSMHVKGWGERKELGRRGGYKAPVPVGQWLQGNAPGVGRREGGAQSIRIKVEGKRWGSKDTRPPPPAGGIVLRIAQTNHQQKESNATTRERTNELLVSEITGRGNLGNQETKGRGR